ncbi:MAG: CRISPR-associated protein Cas4, partial [Gammaproteobacteria bacterium]|nr:CRISPR-associated protein Cas4 [Gammaproteobacteria bacterium]
MYSEDDLLMLSGLQHLAFCERQWALIHLEQVWEENRFTAEGQVLHKRTDETDTEVRGDVRIAHGLRLRSLRLGLSGRADTVEFQRVESEALDHEAGRRTVTFPGVSGYWQPFPVEYKRGKPKKNICDKIQLCAQAMCLEEMLDVSIADGALFYGQSRRRLAVAFDAALRAETESMAARMHKLFNDAKTPVATYEKKCDSCSLVNICLPKTTGVPIRADAYFTRSLA